MRRLILTSSFVAFLAAPVAASAQQAATRSVNDYLCAFAGKCGDQSEVVQTKDAPETRGFSLARPATQAAEPAKRSPTTRGFSLARPAAPAKASASTTKAPVKTIARPAPRSARATPAVSNRKTAVAKVAVKSAPIKAVPAALTSGRADLHLSFQLGSDQLTPQAREEAKVFAQSLLLPELASKRFLIEGHTDRVGSRAYNLELSARRARAVADYLVSLGVPSDRLEVMGHGFDRPLEGRSATASENRRVEAVLVS